ncbi:MAG: acetyltransferase [Bacteroidaceae bacterium]|nr:acetyltransferase [Bacteroidaceae bacterium]
MKNLIIVGLSATSRLALSFVQSHNLYKVIGFAVNGQYKDRSEFCDLPVYTLENLNEEVDSDDFCVFVALLWNHLNADRRNVYNYCKQKNYEMVNLISPLAVIRSEITGDNCWIHDHVVIQNSTKLGSNIAIMQGTLIGADAIVGSHCFFGAHSILAGGCTVGEQSFIGLHATVFDDTHIGRKCIVGACTAVKRNMPDFSKYVTSSDNFVIKEYTENEIENKLVFSKNVR